MEDLFFSDIKELLMLNREEILIMIGLIAGILAAMYIFPRLIFFLYEKNVFGPIQPVITSLIYKLDEFADEMSNLEKRRHVISEIQSLVQFNHIRLPKFVCGWIVDVQVREIRQLQATCSKDSDLHK